MKKLVKVVIAFDLMNQGDTYEANVDEPRTKSLIDVGYLTVIDSLEKLLVSQPESEISEGVARTGGSAPRSKSSGKATN